jgi:hypothetical protein
MSNERFVRWQGNALAQFSAAVALLSGLAVAGLGFLFSLLRDRTFAPAGCYAALFVLAVACFFVAAAAGVTVMITRLLDFRLTARKVRNVTDEPLTFFETDATGYGKATWRLFWLLTISFAVAMVCSVIVLSHVYLGSVIGAIAS